MKIDDWVCCVKSEGYKHENGKPSTRLRDFPESAVGRLRALEGDTATVWLIGSNETWDISRKNLSLVNLSKTGDKFDKKICNTCHCLLNTKKNFAINQRNKHGIVRRPSCRQCRTDIDKKPPKTAQAKAMAKKKPKKGDIFCCPVCSRRYIAEVTVKVVADHDHNHGNTREFICDSCNTGLGKFRNGRYYLKNAIRYIEEREKGR